MKLVDHIQAVRIAYVEGLNLWPIEPDQQDCAWDASKSKPFAEALIAEHAKRNAAAWNLLDELFEWFKDRADADYEGEETGWAGNEEMKWAQEIDDILKMRPKQESKTDDQQA